MADRDGVRLRAPDPAVREPPAPTPGSAALAAAPTQGRDLPLDAHLHSDLSPDSQVPIDVYAADAFRRGIAELAITDHLDFHPGAPAYAYADFDRRERLVREAAERWAGRVAIRLGVELTYERRYDDAIRAHLKSHAYDYTIGSVHPQADSPYTRDRVARFVEGRSFADAVAPYFDEVAAAIRSGLFDTLGHLDYVKRYLIDWYTPADFAAAPELYEPLLRLLVETGTALEVNASGLRHRAGETYPAAWVVERYRELGGDRLSVGSDAHAATHFAYGLEDAYSVIEQAGIRELAFRRGTERVRIALPRRIPASEKADTGRSRPAGPRSGA